MNTSEIAGATIVVSAPPYPRSQRTAPSSMAPVETAFMKR
jgi:hypothetical protein